MALSKKDALEAVRTVLENQRTQELPRLQRIANALDVNPDRSFVPTVQIPEDAPPLMKALAAESETNYLPLLVKTFSQVMKVDGYESQSAADAVEPWDWWQRNRMDSRQTGLTRSAISFGAAYATVLPGEYGRGLKGPSISLYSARKMTGLYQDPEADEWPMLSVAVDESSRGLQTLTLFDDEMVYRFGVEDRVPSLMSDIWSVPYGSRSLVFIEASSHGLAVPPVVRYRDRNLLAGEEQFGVVEPLLRIQERINETTFEMLVAQYFQAFKQRYVLGWVPKDQQEELRAGAARIWYLDEDPADVKIEELPGGSPEPYIKTRESALRDFAAIGQVPVQTLGIDGISNISDATLAGLEAAKNREGGEIMTSLGESHEQLLRLCALVDGNTVAADDYGSEVRWRNFEARSFAQTVDGLGKLATMLGIPADALLEDVPGFTGQRLERVKTAMQQQGATSRVQALVEAARGLRNGDAGSGGGVPASNGGTV
ncbi:phage portal protein [Microbacterium sp. NPDC089190]|uniref:phage portal protein n=1 Tax=Microbacterium sp. NPDC089190 TaxID=3155063 RepID=UPI00344CAABB